MTLAPVATSISSAMRAICRTSATEHSARSGAARIRLDLTSGRTGTARRYPVGRQTPVPGSRIETPPTPDRRVLFVCSRTQRVRLIVTGASGHLGRRTAELAAAACGPERLVLVTRSPG